MGWEEWLGGRGRDFSIKFKEKLGSLALPNDVS